MVSMILSLAGGIGLFLYGMSLLNSSLQQVAGGRLEQTLEKLTNSKLKAFLLGTGVTAVIQSSGATTIMLVGFVNAGIMKIIQAVPVMMGANIGTTMTAQILRLSGGGGNVSSWVDLLKPSTFAPVIVMVGFCSAYLQQEEDEGNRFHIRRVRYSLPGNDHHGDFSFPAERFT